MKINKKTPGLAHLKKILLPGMHMHRYPPLSSMQVPSFWQGFDWHSLMLISQRRPLNPAGQSQRYDPSVLTQTPPCSHGDPVKNLVIIKIKNVEVNNTDAE